jgi:antitoxin FitA
MAPKWRYVEYMPSVQIKNVPPDVHRVMRRRAADAGQSLQEYLLAELTEQARRPTLGEVLERAGGRAGGSVPLADAAAAVRSARDAR